MIRLSETLAGHEDAIDRVREVLEELRADDLDDAELDLADVIERLEEAVREA